MASAFSHAAAALALGTAFWRPALPARFWILGAACAVLPDLDVIAFRFGIPYEHVLGHRGLSHSLFFAALLAAVVVALFFPRERQRGRLWLFFFLATASHASLDALTTGGLGVAFFAPLENSRYFFPWRPIEVSPLSISRFFTVRGLMVLRSEFVWIWLPSLVFATAAHVLRNEQAKLPRQPPSH
ncbi:MAG TPA: metal-dependent hydrolase [Longimicrobium sp.]|jgi:inner membrane protein